MLGHMVVEGSTRPHGDGKLITYYTAAESRERENCGKDGIAAE